MTDAYGSHVAALYRSRRSGKIPAPICVRPRRVHMQAGTRVAPGKRADFHDTRISLRNRQVEVDVVAVRFFCDDKHAEFFRCLSETRYA